MIQSGTYLNVIDNTGVKIVKCIKIIGSSKKVGHIGDKIVVSIRETNANAKIKKGEVTQAIIIRTKKGSLRGDGSYLRFLENSVVLTDKSGELLGSRIFGIIPYEIKDMKYKKIISLAQEIA